MTHACVFCDLTFNRVEPLAAHLVGVHNGDLVRVGNSNRQFLVRQRFMDWEVVCFCYASFSHLPGDWPPRLSDWSPLLPRQGSFAQHLIREGGAAAHLRALRDAALLEKVEHSWRS